MNLKQEAHVAEVEKKDILSSLFLERWHPYFWIVIGCFLLYFKTLAFRFTYFDDNTLILDNLWFLKDIRNSVSIFSQTVFLGGEDFFYRPLLVASFFLDTFVGGGSLVSYHFTNIIVHAVASSIVFVLFERMRYGRRPAFILATIFMVHPVLSQAVAWIPGRNDSLLAVFVLLSFVAFIDYHKDRKIHSLLFHLLCFNLALYTKETAFQIVPLCLLFFVFFENVPFLLKQWMQLVAGWLISGLVWFTMRSTTEAVAAAQHLTRLDIEKSLMDIPLSLLNYIGKILLPFNLSGFPISRDTGPMYGALALVILIAAFLLTDRTRRRYSLFGLLWFLLLILPPFILPINVRLEHRLYLPMIGVFIMLREFVMSRKSLFPSKIVSVAAGCVILLFSGITFVHSDIFMGRLPFWESAVNTSPHSSSAHNSLGVRYLEYGKKELAEQEFMKAIELAPGNVNALINLAGMYMEQGGYERADTVLGKALQLKPREHLVWYNLGLLRYLQGNLAAAQLCWQKTIECNPNYYYAYRTLAVFYSLSGDPVADRYLKKCQDTFKHPVSIPAGATLQDRQWLYRFGLELGDTVK